MFALFLKHEMSSSSCMEYSSSNMVVTCVAGSVTVLCMGILLLTLLCRGGHGLFKKFIVTVFMIVLLKLRNMSVHVMSHQVISRISHRVPVVMFPQVSIVKVMS